MKSKNKYIHADDITNFLKRLDMGKYSKFGQKYAQDKEAKKKQKKKNKKKRKIEKRIMKKLNRQFALDRLKNEKLKLQKQKLNRQMSMEYENTYQQMLNSSIRKVIGSSSPLKKMQFDIQNANEESNIKDLLSVEETPILEISSDSSEDLSDSEGSDSEKSKIEVREGFDYKAATDVELKIHERILNKIRHDKNFFQLFGKLYRQNRISKFNEHKLTSLISEPSEVEIKKDPADKPEQLRKGLSKEIQTVELALKTEAQILSSGLKQKIEQAKEKKLSVKRRLKLEKRSRRNAAIRKIVRKEFEVEKKFTIDVPTILKYFIKALMNKELHPHTFLDLKHHEVHLKNLCECLLEHFDDNLLAPFLNLEKFKQSKVQIKNLIEQQKRER